MFAKSQHYELHCFSTSVAFPIVQLPSPLDPHSAKFLNTSVSLSMVVWPCNGQSDQEQCIEYQDQQRGAQVMSLHMSYSTEADCDAATMNMLSLNLSHDYNLHHDLAKSTVPSSSVRFMEAFRW